MAEKFAIGDKLLATDANELWRGQGISELNAGETINGATLPVPIYVYTDGEVYACDANVSTKLDFLGFAISNSTDGNPIQIKNSGIVAGFSGLTVGARYYLSDTVGTISATPSTSANVLVGIAVSATQLLIIRNPKIYVGAGSSVTRGQSTSNLNAAITITPGFKARAFEATVDIGIVNGYGWGDGSARPLATLTCRMRGTIGGTIVYFYESLTGTEQPSTTPVRNPYLEWTAGPTLTRPTYGSGTCAATSLTIAASGHSITLASITVTDTTLVFTFTSSQSGGNDDVRYGVVDLIVFE